MKITTTFFLLSFLILISQYLVIRVEVKRAKSIIEQTNPSVTGVILPDSGCIRMMNVCMNRVWICPDKHGRVATVPKVGADIFMAKVVIEEVNPDVTVIMLDDKCHTSSDICCNRIYICPYQI
ncbi:hypothetical protein H5410_055086 [Solanum commersonii]|uniref:Uncharacterized protein n=1 Tax=Solanum commersonii TaxID=4109 RepID=A0A9J5WIX9_SOLCO|nr:hypothetical protein H5410_055086 [Solanum commersonii]